MNQIKIEIFAKDSERPLFARLLDLPADLSFDYQNTINCFRALYPHMELVIKFSVSQLKTK